MASRSPAPPRGVAQVVARLSSSVVRSARTTDADILAVAAALATMPARLAERDLGRWEREYWDAAEVASDLPPMDLLRAIFEFGSRNLYGAFDAEWSARTYDLLAATLRASGVHAATKVDVSNW